MLDYVRADRIEFYVTQDAPHPVLLDRTGKESVVCGELIRKWIVLKADF